MCECVVDAFGRAYRGMCVYYVFERGMDRGARGWRGGVGEVAQEMRVF